MLQAALSAVVRPVPRLDFSLTSSQHCHLLQYDADVESGVRCVSGYAGGLEAGHVLREVFH